MKLLQIIKMFACHHNNLMFVRNIYGDEINRVSNSKIYRSKYQCADCGRTIYKQELHEGDNA